MRAAMRESAVMPGRSSAGTTLKSSRHLSIFGYDADEPHAALVDDIIEVAQAAGVFPPGGKAAEIFGVKAIDDEPLLRYLKLC